MDRPLPRPTTAAEMYLAAILDELRALNRRPESVQDKGVVRVKEKGDAKKG